MRKIHLIVLVVGVFAVGLLVAGCGGSDETTSTTEATTATTEDTSATTSDSTSTNETTTEGTDTTSTESSGGTTPDDVYNACIDAIQGTAAEQAGQAACEQAKNAFEQCIKQAEAAGGSAADTAMGICQQAAEQAVKSLESSGG
jgi:hypothetical protein